MQGKYLDSEGNPLEKGKHYLKGFDTDGINPLFYDGKELTDIYGKIVPAEDANNLFEIHNIPYLLKTLEERAAAFSLACSKIKTDLGIDLSTQYITKDDVVGIDGS
jgi:hypothetical protein